MNNNYNDLKKLVPLKFNPSFHYRIWGGNSMAETLNKNISEDSIGESWELSAVNDFISEVSQGIFKGQKLNNLIEIYKEKLVGTKIYEKYKNEFPLLIKFIDTKDVLSVQVHPDDLYAKKHHNSFGKNEMWYILDAKEDSEIIVGFNKNTTKEIYKEKLETEKLEDILRKVKPKKGEVYFIPAGRVHAIGKDIMLLEIQQSSDLTYRIYDFNRKDKNGKLRELHTNHALEVSDFYYIENPSTFNQNESNEITTLENTDFFEVYRYYFSKEKDFIFDDSSFTILIQTKGNSVLKTENFECDLELGQTILIPAQITNFKIEPNKENSNNEVIIVRAK